MHLSHLFLHIYVNFFFLLDFEGQVPELPGNTIWKTIEGGMEPVLVLAHCARTCASLLQFEIIVL